MYKPNNHKLQKFKPTNKGYLKLYDYDYELCCIAHDVVIEHMDKTRDAYNSVKIINVLDVAMNWCGIDINIAKEDTGCMYIENCESDDIIYNQKLFDNFISDINHIDYDEYDEYGLHDEIVKVANIMLKYKYNILLKKERKSIMYKLFKITKT